MRQGQQNRRGRGRNPNQNNNQRKGQNPLTRSFESNGPDVKLRGTPAHIAEKYMSLARDAQSSGDPVLAENYLQHAEHYNRIILTYREQQMPQGGDQGFGGYNGQPARMEGPYNEGEGGDESGEDFSGGDQPPMLVSRQGTDQPRGGENGQGRYEDRPHRSPGDGGMRHQNQGRDRGYSDNRGYERRDRNDRQEGRNEGRPDRGERFDRFDRQDRGEPRPQRDFQDRDRVDRGDRPERTDRPERAERPERTERFDRGDRGPPAPADAPRGEAFPQRRRERTADRLPQDASEQPEFLRRPVRRPRRDEPEEVAAGAPGPVTVAPDDTSRD